MRATPPERIRFRGHAGDEIQGLRARPSPDAGDAGGERWPAIVLVQEVFGLDAHMHSLVERFASEGFVVLAPGLYSREGTPGPQSTPEDPAPIWKMEHIRVAVSSLPDRRVLGDLEAALAELARDPSVDARCLGAVGICMGGNYAFLLGCTSRKLHAVVDFYGRFIYPELSAEKPVQPLEMALNLSVPLLAMFGEEDPSITKADVDVMRAKLAQFAKDFTIVTFPGAGHGFLNEGRKSYERNAAEKAWKLTIDFLHEHLVA